MRSFRELLQLTPADMTDEEWEFCRREYFKLSEDERMKLAEETESCIRDIDEFTKHAEQAHWMPSHPERDA